MKNKKGFVLTETLVVTVFLVTIFTFIYVSIVPLMGKYEDLIHREEDIDIVYKLYTIRKLIFTDANKNVLTASPHNEITCDKFDQSTYCTELMKYLDLNNYLLVYVDDIYENLPYIEGLSEEMYKYISRYENAQGRILILLDLNTHVVAHLLFDDGEPGAESYEVPIYYDFGEVTTSSSMAPPLNKNVYAALYEDEVTKGVCIKISGTQYCFKTNNWLIERKHNMQILGSRNCYVRANNVECSNDTVNFSCRIELNGEVSCTDKSTLEICTVSSSGVVSCS